MNFNQANSQPKSAFCTLLTGVIFTFLFVSIFSVIFLVCSNEVSAYVKSSNFEGQSSIGTRAARTITSLYDTDSSTKRVGVSAGQFAPKEQRFKKYVPPTVISSITVFPVMFDPLKQKVIDEHYKVTPVDSSEKETAEAKDAAETESEEARKAREKAEKDAKDAEEARRKSGNFKEVILSVESEKADLPVSAKTGTFVTLAIVIAGLITYFSVLIFKR